MRNSNRKQTVSKRGHPEEFSDAESAESFFQFRGAERRDGTGIEEETDMIYKKLVAKGRFSGNPGEEAIEEYYHTLTCGLAAGTNWTWGGYYDRKTGDFSLDLEIWPLEIPRDRLEEFFRLFVEEKNLPVENLAFQLIVDGYYMNSDGTQGEPAPGIIEENIRKKAAKRQETVNCLMERYQKKEMGGRLDKKQFQSLFREAVEDYFPGLKEYCADESIYGISFEIGGIVQKVYAENFKTYIYFNTEEQYQEQIKECEEEEKIFYRFEAWGADWNIVTAESDLFERLQDYLEQNSLYACTECFSPDYGLDDEAAAWYEENQITFDDAFEEERQQIRIWMAEALGGLRKDGFWEGQGSAGLYVIPFGGEGDIDTEELEETWLLMDEGYHGNEYLDYLSSL